MTHEVDPSPHPAEPSVNEPTPQAKKANLRDIFDQFPTVSFSGYLDATFNTNQDSSLIEEGRIELYDSEDDPFFVLRSDNRRLDDDLSEINKIIGDAVQREQNAGEKRSKRKHRKLVLKRFHDEIDKTFITTFGKQDLKEWGEDVYDEGSRDAADGKDLKNVLDLDSPHTGGPYDLVQAELIDAELYRWRRQEIIDQFIAEGATDEVQQEKEILEAWRQEHMSTFERREP